MKKLCLLFVIILVFLSGNSYAWNDDITHPHLSRRSVEESRLDAYLKDNLNLPNGITSKFGENTVLKWLQESSELEDNPACRAGNHFHDPLKPWNQAGLTDTLWPVDLWCYFGQYPQNEVTSNVTWATGFLSALPQNKDTQVTAFNEWDWDSAREYYHIYLTGKDFSGLDVASDKRTRDEYMTKSFRALGQVLHLLQDTAVPAHVRNDFSQGHTYIFPDDKSMPWNWFGNWLEHLVKANDQTARWFNQAIGGNLNTVSLTNFWDTDNWDGAVPVINEAYLGIAEFTNQNFVSEFISMSIRVKNAQILAKKIILCS